MLKKLALAGALALAFSALAWAATVNVPAHRDSAGNLQESIGAACLNPTTGDPESCGGGGGGAATIADGADVTQGAKADAKSTATDNTPITMMSVLKQISASMQAFAAALPAGTNIIGKVGIDQTTDGTTNKVAANGKYNATQPVLSDGNRGDIQLGARGSLNVTLFTADSTNTVQAAADNVDGVAASALARNLTMLTRPTVFNGTTWDRAFTCASQTSATVTAAATTQLVALSGSTNIRVCSYQVGIATTGTFKFVSGTGSNCGTGTADITPATNLTAGNVVAVSAGNNSIFRAGASNALCLAAVTGNVQVFVSYAQF